MKKIILVICLFITTLQLKAYDNDMYIKGSIEKIDGSFITVIIDNQKEIFKLAPKWYLMENGYGVKEGEKVEIKYRKVNNVNSITEVTKNRRVYKFTDAKGEFLWKRRGIGVKESKETQNTVKVSDSNGTAQSEGATVQMGRPVTGQTGISITEGKQGPVYIKPEDGFQTGGKNDNTGKESGGKGGREKREINSSEGRNR
jgi:hypothetical protein